MMNSRVRVGDTFEIQMYRFDSVKDELAVGKEFKTWPDGPMFTPDDEPDNEFRFRVDAINEEKGTCTCTVLEILS